MYIAQCNHDFRGGANVEILPPLNMPSVADEANHRIANSLQMLSAMASLEARDIADDAARGALTRMQHRIGAIAGVHRQLYCGRAAGEVDLGEYIQDLGRSLAMSCPAERHVVVHSEAITVPGEDATAIGMIVSELVANACKYAYPAGAPGDVFVQLRSGLKGYLLTVEDRGQGFQSAANDKGLGQRLIASLAQRLCASCNWRSSSAGTWFEMFCPAR